MHFSGAYLAALEGTIFPSGCAQSGLTPSAAPLGSGEAVILDWGGGVKGWGFIHPPAQPGLGLGGSKKRSWSCPHGAGVRHGDSAGLSRASFTAQHAGGVEKQRKPPRKLGCERKDGQQSGERGDFPLGPVTGCLLGARRERLKVSRKKPAVQTSGNGFFQSSAVSEQSTCDLDGIWPKMIQDLAKRCSRLI